MATKPTKAKHAGGRPTDYGPHILELAQEYIDHLPKDEVIHSIEGLSTYIDISRNTIHTWDGQVDKPEFHDIVEKIRKLQSQELFTNGLKGTFNSSITKLMLTKHGYSDKVEADVTSAGEKLESSNVAEIAARAAAMLKEEKTA